MSITGIESATVEQKPARRKRFRTAEDARNAAIELGYPLVCFDYGWYRWIPCENKEDPRGDRTFYEVEMSARDMEDCFYDHIESMRPLP